MSDLFSFDTQATAPLEAAARANSVDSLSELEAPAFHGVFTGTGSGIMRGGARVARAAGLAGGALLRMTSAAPPVESVGPEFTDPKELDQASTDLLDNYFHGLDQVTEPAIDYWTPAPHEVGKAGQILGSLGEVLLPLAAGGGNPALLMGTQGLTRAADLTEAGVDAGTAIAAGTTEAAATGLGFKVPVLGSTLTSRLATGAAGNVGFGLLSRGAESALLNARGYEKQAPPILDVASLTTDALTGLLFGGLHHTLSPRIDPRLAPSQADAVLAARNSKSFTTETAPGKPADIASEVAHQDALQTSLEQLSRSEPVDVSGVIAEPSEASMLESQVNEILDRREQALRSVTESPDAQAVSFRNDIGRLGEQQSSAKTALDEAAATLAESRDRQVQLEARRLALADQNNAYAIRRARESGGTGENIFDKWKRQAEENIDAQRERAKSQADLARNVLQNVDRDMARVNRVRSAETDLEQMRYARTNAASLADLAAVLPAEARDRFTAKIEAIGNPALLRQKIPRFEDNGKLAESAQLARDVEAGQPTDVPYESGPPLTQRFEAELAAHPVAAENRYNALPESEGGKVLNVDIARELSPEYQADRTLSAQVHEPASAFIKQLYAKKLAQRPGPGEKPLVIFSAGGTGAGKSSGIDTAGAQIVYDTNMNRMESATQKIDQALQAGKRVEIVYTYRNPIEALTGGALKRAMRQETQLGSGRTVPLSEHVGTHIGSRDVIERVAAHYAGDPRVNIRVIDNSLGKGKSRATTLGEIPKFDEAAYNRLREEASTALAAEHKAGRISDAVYRGFNQDAGRPGGLASGRSASGADGRQTQPAGAEPLASAESGKVPELAALQQLATERPDAPIYSGFDADGQPIRATLADVADQIQREYAQDLKDAKAYQVAVQCFLGHGA